MTKLNWRDASKELPEIKQSSPEYLVVICCIRNNKLIKYVSTAFVGMDDIGDSYFTNINDCEMVTHWALINEIPLPGE